jgi:hypothetical protein
MRVLVQVSKGRGHAGVTCHGITAKTRVVLVNVGILLVLYNPTADGIIEKT